MLCRATIQQILYVSLICFKSRKYFTPPIIKYSKKKKCPNASLTPHQLLENQIDTQLKNDYSLKVYMDFNTLSPIHTARVDFNSEPDYKHLHSGHPVLVAEASQFLTQKDKTSHPQQAISSSS